MLRTDIEAVYDNGLSARSHEEIILFYPFIEAISIPRLYRAGAPMIPRMTTVTRGSMVRASRSSRFFAIRG